ncbi:hypothetical protein MKW98_016539 [Papaver atlanticum]|uniref:Uncharacterized protein n=1 Tax=Papaver atlanticum TaxID=357466 RepID=A0AAD4X690_9MAGN|nr:hypothetical protein MKW98_016539 [Papaver atlanticum]
MDSAKKSNKISEIVRLQQKLKKWRKIASAPKNTIPTSPSSAATPSLSHTNSTKKFLKKTLSFKDTSPSAAASTDGAVPKGFLAVCVGREMKRFIIPTEFLAHRAFEMLLREAEEEFGFQHEGILRIPCEVCVFERILKMVEEKKEVFFINQEFLGLEKEMSNGGCCSSEAEFSYSLHSHNPLCR